MRGKQEKRIEEDTRKINKNKKERKKERKIDRQECI
jgi:hypothetical protein